MSVRMATLVWTARSSAIVGRMACATKEMAPANAVMDFRVLFARYRVQQATLVNLVLLVSVETALVVILSPAIASVPQCGNCTIDGSRTACDSKTGACLKCPIGKAGANCQHSCEDGTWGENCANKCTCSDGHKCDPVSGKCICDHGYTGKNCEQKCPEGKWGVDCANECPSCVNGAKCNHQCDPKTGECACPAGWQGDRCNVPCEDGFYGPDCINKCKCRGTSSASCHRVTGACQCHPGFTGEFCHALCPKGHYGLRCARECGDCGVGYECDAAIGCCHADQLSCGQALLEFQRQQGEHGSRAGIILLALVVFGLASVLLVSMMLYYRRKYFREKEPDVPTVV
ncbi:EGF domain-containing protein [Trichostrongylus colubriformis]|uniref:EGF domain-containing protein n=1 Tax=Trichostrongylus colubriformis TaxID=6319 RepID=A0AAN8FYI3_TRICO